MMRSTVLDALCVCSVPRTRWPVSAAVSAIAIVSRSRISPTRITSGSWRSAARSASAKLDGVGADLALVDDAPLVAVHELDRVLDREDVVGARSVHLVDQRRERRRLAGAGRAGDEDEAARLLGELVQGRGEAELLERLDRFGNEAEGGADRAALEVDVDAEAREARDAVREVELPLDLEVLLLLAREDPVDELLRVLRRQRRELLESLNLAVHADRGVVPAVRCRSDALCATTSSNRSSIEYVRMPVPRPSYRQGRLGLLELGRLPRSRGMRITSFEASAAPCAPTDTGLATKTTLTKEHE